MKIFKIASLGPSTLELKDFSNSESLCCSVASHKVLAQSALWFGRRCRLKNFKTVAAILDVGIERIYLAVLNFFASPMPHTKFHLIQNYLSGALLFQDFQAGHHGGYLGYCYETNLTILNLHIIPMPPIKFGLNLTYRFGADVV